MLLLDMCVQSRVTQVTLTTRALKLTKSITIFTSTATTGLLRITIIHFINLYFFVVDLFVDSNCFSFYFKKYNRLGCLALRDY